MFRLCKSECNTEIHCKTGRRGSWTGKRTDTRVGKTNTFYDQNEIHQGIPYEYHKYHNDFRSPISITYSTFPKHLDLFTTKSMHCTK